MTFRIEKDADHQSTTIRLIGRIQSEHLDELKTQLALNAPRLVLDLDDVTLVNVDVVRFLSACETEGIELLNCPCFVREWIAREQHGKV